jgi:hypothetical protein
MKSSHNLIARINKGCHQLKVPYARLSPLMENNRWSPELHEVHEATCGSLCGAVSTQTITGAPSEVVEMDLHYTLS